MNKKININLFLLSMISWISIGLFNIGGFLLFLSINYLSLFFFYKNKIISTYYYNLIKFIIHFEYLLLCYLLLYNTLIIIFKIIFYFGFNISLIIYFGIYILYNYGYFDVLLKYKSSTLSIIVNNIKYYSNIIFNELKIVDNFYKNNTISISIYSIILSKINNFTNLLLKHSISNKSYNMEESNPKKPINVGSNIDQTIDDLDSELDLDEPKKEKILSTQEKKALLRQKLNGQRSSRQRGNNSTVKPVYSNKAAKKQINNLMNIPGVNEIMKDLDNNGNIDDIVSGMSQGFPGISTNQIRQALNMMKK